MVSFLKNNFVTHGRTPLLLAMQILWSDICQQFFKRKIGLRFLDGNLVRFSVQVQLLAFIYPIYQRFAFLIESGLVRLDG